MKNAMMIILSFWQHQLHRFRIQFSTLVILVLLELYGETLLLQHINWNLYCLPTSSQCCHIPTENKKFISWFLTVLTYHAILSIIALLFDIFYESNKLLRPNYNGTSNEESIFRPLHLKEGLSWLDKGVNLLGILSDVRHVALIITNYCQKSSF